MYALCFGTYCYYAKSKVCVPCEVGVSRYTMRDGETDKYFRLIDPGVVPKEYDVCFYCVNFVLVCSSSDL
jgi:hypothetical protein